MEYEEYIRATGERIDRLVSLDVPARSAIQILYPLARGKSKEPLCLAAARLLEERVHQKEVVFLATGVPNRPHINPAIAETDGPVGAAALARALHHGLGAVSVILVEDLIIEGMSRVTRAAGFRVLSPDEAIAAAHSRPLIRGAAVIGFPTDAMEAQRKARELIEQYKPAAIIAIEKGGMNEKEKIHSSRGDEYTATMAKIDYLVLEARKRNIATFGIGDGGNELGMGVIQEEIKKSSIPWAAKCRCGCGGGIAPATPTDVLITATVSNWGAYGIAACLAALLQRPEVLHDAKVEEALLQAAADASFIDGATGYVIPGADSLASPVHQAFITLLAETVRQSLRYFKEGTLLK